MGRVEARQRRRDAEDFRELEMHAYALVLEPGSWRQHNPDHGALHGNADVISAAPRWRCNFTMVCDGARRSPGEISMHVGHLRALSVGCLAILALALLHPGAVRAQDYAAVLAQADRSDADRQTDKRRDALKLLTFIGPK